MNAASCLLLLVLTLLAASPSAASTAPVQAISAYDFESGVGVNVHSAVSTRQFAALLKDIEFLGIHHLRDGIRPLHFADAKGSLALTLKSGIAWDVIIPSSPAPFRSWLIAHHAGIDSVEGPNEPNLEGLQFDGLVGTQAAAELQYQIYQMVKTDPVLSRTQILNYSMGYYKDPTPPINLAQDFDAQNLHIYPGRGEPPMHDLVRIISLARGWNSAPIIVSEIGYATTGISCAGTVSSQRQAVYILDSLLDDTALGVSRTYLYDLIDDGVDPSGCNKEKHYGLFDLDGSPKPAATALHDFLTRLEDDSQAAPRFHPGSLSFDVEPVIPSLLIEKSNGLFYLVLWQETSWPSRNGMVDITVKQTASFKAFDPITGDAAVASAGVGRQFQVSAGIDPLIVEIKPAGTDRMSP